MDITPRIASDRMVIQSYKDGQFKVSGQFFDSSVLVYGGEALPWCTAKDIESLTEDDLAPIIASKQRGEFEVLLIGTGQDFKFLNPALKAHLQKNGITPEMMNTGAACRTFNVLLAESRAVCAAMLTA
tara:strand:+ start:75454 stop:75837 length:384 start_codon:yes stop_codon:yes gene_type:complete